MQKEILKKMNEILQKLHLPLNEKTRNIFAKNIENYIQNHPDASMENIIINSVKNFILKKPQRFIEPYIDIYRKGNEIFNGEDNRKNFQTFVIITFNVLIHSSVIEKENDIYALYCSMIKKGKPNLTKIDGKLSENKGTKKEEKDSRTEKQTTRKEVVKDGLFKKIRSDEEFKHYSDETLNEYLQMFIIKCPKSVAILKLRHNEDFLGWNENLDKKNRKLYNCTLHNFKIFIKSEKALQKPKNYFTKMRSYKECEHLSDEELIKYLKELEKHSISSYEYIIERHGESLKEWNPFDHPKTQRYQCAIQKLLKLIRTKEQQKLMIRLINVLKYAKEEAKEMPLQITKKIS